MLYRGQRRRRGVHHRHALIRELGSVVARAVPDGVGGGRCIGHGHRLADPDGASQGQGHGRTTDGHRVAGGQAGCRTLHLHREGRPCRNRTGIQRFVVGERQQGCATLLLCRGQRRRRGVIGDGDAHITHRHGAVTPTADVVADDDRIADGVVINHPRHRHALGRIPVLGGEGETDWRHLCRRHVAAGRRDGHVPAGLGIQHQGVDAAAGLVDAQAAGGDRHVRAVRQIPDTLLSNLIFMIHILRQAG